MEEVKGQIRLPGKKKIIILAIGIGVPVVVVILSLAMQSSDPSASGILAPTPSSMPQQNENGKMPGNNVQSPTSPVVTVASQNGIPKWKVYEGSSYTIAVPPDWSAHPNQEINGGEVVIVRPDILPTGVNSPEFIFYSNLNANIMEQKVNVLKGLGFKESKITVLGKSASKFSGTLSSSMVGDQRVDQSIQITDIYFTQGDKLYVFSYQYIGATPSKLLEDYFTDIVNGIRLK